MMKVNMNGSLSRAARMLLGFVALLGAAFPAFAEGNTINLGSNSVWTVYAFGNAQAVADAFRALTNFSSSPVFQSIVSMVGVIGVLGVGASGGFNPAMAKRLIGYFVSVFLVCYVFFGVGNGGPLVVNVEVIDTVDNTWKAPVTVPAVVGIPAAILSSAGFKITQAIEASFALPTELKMSNGAPFNLAASMIADASQARITDPNLASSLAYYVQDCFTIGVARGTLKAETLIQSTKFLEDIKFDNQAVMVNTLLLAPVGNPGIVSCGEAWTLINNAVNAQGTTAADFLKDASAWTKTPAMSVLNAAADSTAQWASNNGVTDGAALVKQSAVLSAFRGAYSQAANQTGNSEFLTGIAMSQATEAQRTSWITGAEVFNKTMGYVFAIIQVFVYAITPLVLCAALVPSLGMALLKNFSQILLWLAIWQPMLAIVNFIIISMQQAELGGILSNGATYGFTLSNVGIVSEKTANLRAAASFVGTMVPALAWAMVKGSVDFSRVIGSAVGENFAQGAANTMTTGNYSLNQASMDSFTANKHSTAATGAWGGGFSNSGAVGSKETNTGGSMLASEGEQRLGVSTTATQGANDGGNRGNSTTVTTGAGSGTSAANGTTTGASATGTQGGGNTVTSSAGTGTGANVGVGAGYSVKDAQRGRPADGSGPSAANGQGPGAQGGQQPAAGGDTPASFGKGALAKLVAPLGLSASAGLSATTNTGSQDANSNSNTHNKSVTGGTTGSESTTLTSSTNGSKGDTAGKQSGYQKGENENVTGITSSFTRAQMMAQHMRMENSMTGGEWAMPTAVKSDAGDKVAKLGTTGAVGADVAKEQAAVGAKQQGLDKKVDRMDDAAHAQQTKNRDKAMDVYGRESAAADATKAPAQVSALDRAKTAVGNTDLVKGAASMYNNAKDALGIGGPEVKLPEGAANLMPKDAPQSGGQQGTQPGKNADQPAPNAKPNSEAGNKQPEQQAHGKQPEQQAHGKQPEQQAAQHAKPNSEAGNKQPQGKQPEQQRQETPQHRSGEGNQPQHGKQPEQHTAQHAKPNSEAGNKHPDGKHPDQQPHGKQPEQGKQAEQRQAAAPGRPGAGQPADGNALAQALGNHPQVAQQPHDGKNGNDKPQQLASQSGNQHDREQLAQQDRQQQQRERELQERQLAAANAVGQLLQTAQAPQQPQAPQPGAAQVPGAMDGAQHLAALNQQPGAAGESAAPNPFGGEKAPASEGQMQGQVQMAEQRAERMSNQLRGAEGMLASADGRKPNELPELINQARDLMRNA
jgi:hypothetical protein